MTQDEIIEMAMNSGLPSKEAVRQILWWIEDFAKLVAIKEREACAREVENVEDSPNPIINMTIRLAAAAVRERGQE
jgi:hypothetical protein